ncbi:thiamine-binding protein [Slackia heliotrinireducens]|uniref:thiamine-binding protein n=1 Tax=Slackia heliotrinireducens TaxID=84110 RepID=UPI003315B425
MECAIALQYLTMDSTSDAETCRVVDEVIAAIDASGLDYYVGPFETTVEGDFDSCMALLKTCLEAGAAAGCKESASYVKISWRPGGRVMSTDDKIGKYHPTDSEFSVRNIA